MEKIGTSPFISRQTRFWPKNIPIFRPYIRNTGIFRHIFEYAWNILGILFYAISFKINYIRGIYQWNILGIKNIPWVEYFGHFIPPLEYLADHSFRANKQMLI